MQQGSSWFKRTKSTASTVAASRPSFLGPSKTGLSHTQSAVAASSSPSGTAAAGFPGSADGGTGNAAAAGGVPATEGAEAAPAAGVGVQMPRSSSGRLGGSDGQSSPRSLRRSISGGSSASGSGSGSGAGQRPLPPAPSPHAGGLHAAEQAVEQAMSSVQEAAAEAVQQAEEAAGDTIGSLGDKAGQSPVSLADPVSLLKRATQHTRNSSVDAEAVMAALEENGFHATDAYMGAFFYTRVSLVGMGDEGSSSYCSKVVPLSLGGEASWDQGFWLPLVRPAPPQAALELELYAAKDDK